VTRVVVAGASGRTGAPVTAGIAAADDLDLVARVAPSLAGAGDTCYGSLAEALADVSADVLVDLTQPGLGEEHAVAGLASGLAVVLGTTGLDAAARDRVDAAARAAELPAFYAPNFSLGAVLAMQFAEQAAALFTHVEIVELHSQHKLDAPSGTAEATAERIRMVTGHDVPIHSVRLPGLVAHQETLLGAEGQLLTIRHDAISREAFVPGVLLAVRRVHELPPGLTVGLETFLAA
jgi:4-hydroxy-tetrahydrodipicolinate reductase